MLKVMVECGNVPSEKVARHLERRLDSYRVWVYQDRVYASFVVEDIHRLRKIRNGLKRLKGVELRVVKVGRVEEGDY